MKVIGYIRVSTDKQDLTRQKHLLFQYAQQQRIIIDEFIEIEVSSRKSTKERRIDELLATLSKDDTLLVAELSRLGRNMLETLNIINTLIESGINIIFIRQPELSTNAGHTKLLLAIYSYFAEAERDFISLRTKQGLAAAKDKGKILGRPKGSKNKSGSVLTPYQDEIKELLSFKIPVNSIRKIINQRLEKPASYSTYKNFIQGLGSRM